MFYIALHYFSLVYHCILLDITGGVPDLALMTDGVYTTGFQGCIHRLSIGEEQLINFMDRALSGVNVKTCPR